MKQFPIFYKLLLFIVGIMVIVFVILGVAQNLLVPSIYKNDLESKMIETIEGLYLDLNSSDPDNHLEIVNNFLSTNNGRMMIYDLTGQGLYGNTSNLPIRILIQLNEESIIIEEIDTLDQNFMQVLMIKTEYVFVYQRSLEGLNQSISLINDLFLYITSLGIIMSILTAWFISKRFSKPIHQLIQLTKSNDLSVPYNRRNDEFNTLMVSFISMKKRLKDSIDTLKNELEKEKKQEQLSKTFIANISHEIRTPISVIQSAIDLLTVTSDTDKVEMYYKMIHTQIKLIEKLTDDVMLISKLQSHTNTLNKKHLGIYTLVEDITNELSLIHRDVKFDHIKPKSAKILHIDALSIRQVIINVLNNAIKFRNINAMIEIKYQQYQDYFDILIFNEAKPIEDEHLPFLNQTFYKVNSDGLGLGLAIVDQVMKAHDGSFYIRNIKEGVQVVLRFYDV
jgi:signal transduction histidine kinase